MSIDASGSVAGIQFSKNRYGNFGSRKSTSTRAQGDVVLAYRANIGRAHHHFDTFSAAEKASWNLTPDTHVKPREHYVKLHLTRAARGLTTGHTYPGLRGPNTLLELLIGRQAAPLTLITAGWLRADPRPAYMDFIARASYIQSYDGHPRKFKWQMTKHIFDEFAIFPLTPYARFLTLHVALRDYYTLHTYARWVYHFDDDALISVTPDPPAL